MKVEKQMTNDPERFNQSYQFLMVAFKRLPESVLQEVNHIKNGHIGGFDNIDRLLRDVKADHERRVEELETENTALRSALEQETAVLFDEDSAGRVCRSLHKIREKLGALTLDELGKLLNKAVPSD